ncbi:MAG: DUF3048 domain-containing protein [Dethiobacteria bacterium]|jgi:hypothetical protein
MYYIPKKIFFLGCILLLLLMFFGCNTEANTIPEENASDNYNNYNNDENKEEEKPAFPPSPYTGLPQEEILSRPFAVLIDNHGNARPQSGLQEAPLVYEAIAEGEITRLMAIFAHPVSGKLGPIRSARPYFAHLARENDAILIHCGSSREAEKILAQNGYDHIDERPYPKYFQRDHKRYAPHNLYTDLESLLQAAEDFNIYHEISPQPPFTFYEKPLEGLQGDVREVQLPFSSYNYVSYRWDESMNAYLRFTRDQPHKDANTDQQIAVKNILVQYVPFHYISKVHRQYDLVGEGSGLYVSNGKAQKIRWKKESYGQRTKYFSEDGSPLVLSPGNTWIHIISPKKEAVLIKETE